MSEWSPPEVPREVLVVVGVAYAAFVVYALVVAQTLLLAAFVGVTFVALYLGWRLLAAIEAIANALQRIAAERERRGTE